MLGKIKKIFDESRIESINNNSYHETPHLWAFNSSIAYDVFCDYNCEHSMSMNEVNEVGYNDFLYLISKLKLKKLLIDDSQSKFFCLLNPKDLLDKMPEKSLMVLRYGSATDFNRDLYKDIRYSKYVDEIYIPFKNNMHGRIGCIHHTDKSKELYLFSG